MINNYLFILLFILIASLFALSFYILALFINKIVKSGKKNTTNLEPYESGWQPLSIPRQPFAVQYYLLAILFLIFEVEIVLLVPLVLLVKVMSWKAFVAFIVFLWMMFLGLIYEWKKGSLNWE